MATVDDALCALGAVPISLPWDRFELLPDGQHFPYHSQLEFNECLSAALAGAIGSLASPPRRILVITDSTVGYGDFEGPRTGRASRLLEQSVHAATGIPTTVDAVCGSGYVAMASSRLNFRRRVLNGKDGEDGEDGALVLVGGWNDDGRKGVREAVEGVVAAWRTERKRSAACGLQH